MKRGFCDHKDKKSRIVTEWKCVDIRFPDTITPDEKKKREAECRAKDYYGVCDLCRWFIPDPEPTGQPDTNAVYTAKTPKAAENVDFDIDDLI